VSGITDVATAIGTVVAAIGTVVTAGAAVYAACLARQASDTWRKGLEHQRVDEATSAVHGVRSKIDRVISLMEAKQDVWPAYNDAWSSWGRFDQAYAVARRYRASLPDEADGQFANLLIELEMYCRSYAPQHGGIPSDHQANLIKLKDNVHKLAASTEKALRDTTA
jgi:hypothetical protein